MRYRHDSRRMTTEKPRIFTVSGREHGNALIDVLADRLAISKKRAKRLLDDRVVFIDGQRIWMARHEVVASSKIEVQGLGVEKAAKKTGAAGISVLYEDDALIVAFKPVGILSNEGDSVESRLRTVMGNPRIYAVHRLDRDTTGCLLLAKDASVRDAMIPLFRERAVEKTYHAIVAGSFPGRRTIRTPIDGQPAITHATVLQRNAKASVVELDIETGRTHQIRRHLLDEGFPVLGDKEYSRNLDSDPLMRRVPRQMLHASCVAFPHPVTGVRVDVSAPVPEDFRSTCKQFGLRPPSAEKKVKAPGA